MKKIVFLLAFFYSATSFATLPEDYETWYAHQKLDYLWAEKITPTLYEELPELSGQGWFDILKSLKTLTNLGDSFDHVSDEIPEGREKIIHAYGSVAKAYLRITHDTPYTGLFKGASGLMRMSLASSPDSIGFTPGMALKLFIDQQPSANVQVMQSVDGQGENHNFFEHTFTNILPEPEGLVLKMVFAFFSLFVDEPLNLPLQHFGFFTASGLAVDQPASPTQILFVPTEAVQMDEDSEADFRVALQEIEANTVIYTVLVKAEAESDPEPLGELINTSGFVSSQYADENLFFKHQR